MPVQCCAYSWQQCGETETREEGKGNVSNIFARKSMAVLKAEAEETEVQALLTHGGVPLKRTLSAWSLISLGIGCIIGAGIFVLTGHAAATNAGPAIALSFVLGGIACAFA